MDDEDFDLVNKLRNKICNPCFGPTAQILHPSSPMDQRKLPPHVLIFPLPLQGPVNSMFKLAELLCLSSLHITVVVTEDIHGRLVRFANIQSRFDRYPGFQLKTIPDGLPKDHPRTGDKFLELFHSLKSKSKPLFKEMLTSGCLSSKSRRPVSFIVADGILGFTCDVAQELGIPIVGMRTISPCCLWVSCCLPKLIEDGELPFEVCAGDDLDKLIKSVTGTESFLRRRDLPDFFRLGDIDNEYIQLCRTEAQENARAYGLILNTFEELDGSILSCIQTICPNIYTIGPLHAHLRTKQSKETTIWPASSSSSSLWKEDMSCLTWLDAQPSKSVIYVSFGSITTLTKEQLNEFWHGLVNSGSKFLWVIRPDSIAGDQSQIPVELAEGTKLRGCIVAWAPQEKVLDHPAVGGFLTHSGWNSTLESIYAGVPMICWPFFFDQQVNSRFVSEVWKLGLDMKDTCDRDVIEKMVRELMQVRKEEILQRADEMAKLARICLGEGGSSHSSLARLVGDIYSMSAS